MNNETLKFIQGQIGYGFKNSDLLQQAFVRRSYAKENGGEDNEVLEFIGDKALDLVIVKLLTEKYGSYAEDYDDYNPHEDCNEFVSDFSEGKLTETKKKLVCREMLASRIRMFGFQYELIMGKSDVDQKVLEQDSVQEDLFEAIIGAVALDSEWNLNTLTTVVDLMLDPNYFLENGFNQQTNYVELLQQWCQKKHSYIPVYVYRKIDFPYSRLRYEDVGKYICEFGLQPFGKGFEAVGETKSKARMAVAEKAYRYLEDNGLLVSWIDEIGEPDRDRAINQLQELYQKGYIGEPRYEFSETYDDNGNPVWRCECHVDGQHDYWWGNYSSKKQGKKDVAYDMLCYILDWEDKK